MLVVLFSHLNKEEDVGGEEDAGRLRALENWGCWEVEDRPFHSVAGCAESTWVG